MKAFRLTNVAHIPVNSSAPISGVDILRLCPSKSSVCPLIAIPEPSRVQFPEASKCKSLVLLTKFTATFCE